MLALIAILARAAVQLAVNFYEAPEAWEYDTLARNLVAGQGYVIEHDGTTHRAFTFPLYPLMLAAVYSVTGLSAVGVGAVQAVLGGLLVVLTYLFAMRMGRGIAILAALGVATHPGLLVYAAKIHALNLHAVLGVATALIARAAWERPDLRHGVIAGVLGGVAGLERTTFVPTLGLALGIAGWRQHGARIAVALVVVWFALTMAFIGPWLARNALALGDPVLTTTGNEALWRGNNPHATGGNLAGDGRPMLEAATEVRQLVWGKTDLEQDDEFRRASIQYMSADPGRTLAWTAQKTLYFWWFGPQVGLNYPVEWASAYALYYVAVLAFAVVGVLAGSRIIGGPSLAAIALTVIPVSLLQAVFYVEGRHRWAIEPLLIVLAAAGSSLLVQDLWTRLRRGSS